MAKNSNQLILALGFTVLSVLGIILMMTTPFLAINEASDQYFRIFYDGDTKWRIGNFSFTGEDPNFPEAVPILILIGIIIIILGSSYMTVLAISNKNCIISNRKAPGPITGIFSALGGILGFIGMMVFLAYGIDKIKSNSNYGYGFGFIFGLIVFVIFILFGAYLLILTLLNKDKKRKSTKKKSKKK
ncbi:MAG: hypothetical protein ACTSQK_09760 [Candidatus Heimdallarchaeota archaeon]